MTFLSGAMDVSGAGLVHDPSKPSDHKTMYQLISSPIVNTPPPSYVVKLLHSSQKPLYVPLNGHRSTNAISDTKEDMMEIFTQEPDGRPREMRKLMGRRGYVAVVAYDPEAVVGAFGGSQVSSASSTHKDSHGQQQQKRLSLAVDFMIQTDPNAGISGVGAGPGIGGIGGSAAAAVGTPAVSKYGPVIIPSLEFGR